VSRRTANKKPTEPSRERSPKPTNYTFRTKKVEWHDFQIGAGATECLLTTLTQTHLVAMCMQRQLAGVALLAVRNDLVSRVARH